ncbi:MAG TPA: alkaline phosphatase family protein [Stellaceae bacterium]|nr:alkaline phosphatase family protein [Stellaceae bacterium]
MRWFGVVAAALVLAAHAASAAQPHNVVLFVPDGLRALSVDPQAAPAMAAVRDRGVAFPNSHSLFPTFTTANASAMATGHYLGDTGDFSNSIYVGFPVASAGNSVTPFLESDAVLGEVDRHFRGDYLDETTILAAARARGFGTAAVGKVGPALIFDHTDRTGAPTIVIDDATGSRAGIPLAPEVERALAAAGLPLAAPGRGANRDAGDASRPGTQVANVTQQDYFAAAATKVVLPLLKAKKRPFVLVFWSRDPDGTQHNQGDSLDALTPGINGPTSRAAIRNADDDLARIEAALDTLGLAATTDILIAADHGFATISKESHTSAAAKARYKGVPQGELPPGFLAIDLAAALDMKLYDPGHGNAPLGPGAFPNPGSALIGPDPAHPALVVAANGGSDLVYLPTRDKALARRVVAALLQQDYVSGLFVDPALGAIPGTLPLRAIGLSGKAATPIPAIAVNFRSFATGCAAATQCTAVVADTPLQQGQGMHGSFSRAETMNFMAAAGPDFKHGFVDPAPVSNADVGRTIAKILGLKITPHGTLLGRVIAEAMPGGKVPAAKSGQIASKPADHLATLLDYQAVGRTLYFDAAGFPGRTQGLAAPPMVQTAK